MKNTKSRPTTAKVNRKQRPVRPSASLLVPPLPTRRKFVSTTQVDTGLLVDDGFFAEMLVDLPGIQIFRVPQGYLVDRVTDSTVKIDGSGDYSIGHKRELVSRELALHRLLLAVTPDEFLDLLKPLAMELEIAHDFTQANLKEKIV